MEKVYISGPVTGIENFMDNFAKAEKELKDKGYTVINPTKVNNVLVDILEYDEFMHMCYAMLDLCTYIYMLPGWEKSNGANLELAYANNKGIKRLN